MFTYKLHRIFTNHDATSGNTKIEKFRKFIIAYRCQHFLLQETIKKRPVVCFLELQGRLKFYLLSKQELT